MGLGVYVETDALCHLTDKEIAIMNGKLVMFPNKIGVETPLHFRLFSHKGRVKHLSSAWNQRDEG